MVTVVISCSVPRQQALIAAGIALPPLSTGLFLIDTGASHTVIDPTLLAPLQLTPTGIVQVHTPSTNGAAVNCNQYDVELAIHSPNGAPFDVPALAITESSVAAQGIAGLIGRDVLSRCQLYYNGVIGHYTLSY